MSLKNFKEKFVTTAASPPSSLLSRQCKKKKQEEGRKKRMYFDMFIMYFDENTKFKEKQIYIIPKFSFMKLFPFLC